MSREMKIPFGWRVLEGHELIELGDRFWSNDLWHNTYMVGHIVEDTFVYIRPLTPEAENPNFHLDAADYVPQVSAGEKVKEYLKKLNDNKA